MTSEDTSRTFSLTPWSLQQSASGTDGTNTTGQNSAEETQHAALLQWQDNAGNNSAQTGSHLRAEALQLVRTESLASGISTTAQTQIAARSAQFGGAVTVEGNLNVKGSVRVLPVGDLAMGAFHKGTRPDGTIDSGN